MKRQMKRSSSVNKAAGITTPIDVSDLCYKPQYKCTLSAAAAASYHQQKQHYSNTQYDDITCNSKGRLTTATCESNMSKARSQTILSTSWTFLWHCCRLVLKFSSDRQCSLFGNKSNDQATIIQLSTIEWYKSSKRATSCLLLPCVAGVNGA